MLNLPPMDRVRERPATENWSQSKQGGSRSVVGSKAEKLRASKCFLLLPQQRTFIRRRDYDVTNQPPSLAFIWHDEKSAPVHRHFHLRPSTRRVAAERHPASNAPRCRDRKYSQIWLGRTGLVFSTSMIECWRCRSRSCA